MVYEKLLALDESQVWIGALGFLVGLFFTQENSEPVLRPESLAIGSRLKESPFPAQSRIKFRLPRAERIRSAAHAIAACPDHEHESLTWNASRNRGQREVPIPNQDRDRSPGAIYAPDLEWNRSGMISTNPIPNISLPRLRKNCAWQFYGVAPTRDILRAAP